MSKKLLLSFFSVLFLLLSSFAQKNTAKKYPSLFWEITGNGLKKPSYLFGTMHVSSKMAFHLSDSFYYAIKNVDAVALELNPDLWQGQMAQLDALKQNYSNYARASGGDYLNENSFRLNKYDDELKLALSTEPAVVNSLLYRTYKTKEDFEEDTFLDLYIFQTGRKLGKRATGVEDYYETEKLVLQAYADMATEKKKKDADTDRESMRTIGEKIQEAYKRGDLDLMDSLDNLADQSIAFRAKFLYRRNEIQAASMDSIMKKSSLFVGVGAAHLPGERGVIELLRKAGYRLRPVKMVKRDAAQKDAVNKLKVPVTFSSVQSTDGFYTVALPGPLFKVSEEYSRVDRRQYADMSNGIYYQVARVRTYAAFLHQTETVIQKKIDSLLYEYIPGKILKRKSIQKNGYSGCDITNKTRRGDLQRYNIFITPFEILIFKMSGKENYVAGKEATQFFSSIELKEAGNSRIAFSPKQGGFSIILPQAPTEYFNGNKSDNINRWEYEAANKTTGEAYLILRKAVYNFKFLDEDTFDLKLIEESFRCPDFFERQLQRKLGSFKGYPCLDVIEKMKDSSIVTARYIIKGPQYFLLAASSKNNSADAGDFFNSFNFTPYQYFKNALFSDTFLHFSVTTPVAPALDNSYRATLEKVTEDISGSSYYSNYWPKKRNAIFSSDSTGETISVGIQKYPSYFYESDSSTFWKKVTDESYNKKDLLLFSKNYIEKSSGAKGYTFSFRDTGSSRTINQALLLKDNYLFSLLTLGDTLHQQNRFIDDFFRSFTPEKKQLGSNIFINCLDSFFSNLFSRDSAIQAKAQQAISNIQYGEAGVPKIMEAIKKLSPANKNYFNRKARLIAELGYINDTIQPVVVKNLQQLYKQTADTSLFQNEVLEALAKHKTAAATSTFKELILHDPPVFDNRFSYTALFNNLEDSLQLAATLFPDLLQLTTLEDYKEPVTELLAKLVDSGYIKAPQYESWFNKIYFDARIALKKQQGKDEKKMEAENRKDNDDEPGIQYNNNGHKDALDQYAALLMPFYDQNPTVPKFFDKLLQSKEETLRLNTAILLLRNNKPLPDSILTAMAATDQLRGKLFARLQEIKRTDRFPAQYKTQLLLARSYLVENKDYDKIDSVAFICKQPATCNGKKGMVYFFKYKIKKGDDWKIGISGLQPEKPDEVSSDDALSSMTGKKLKEDKPEAEQLQEQLKRLLFNFHKSAKNFFTGGRNNYRSESDE